MSVLRPKFSGLLGEALDVAARWSGDVVSTSFFNFLFIYCEVGMLQVLMFSPMSSLEFLQLSGLFLSSHFCSANTTINAELR